jgi:hypothetical protein
MRGAHHVFDWRASSLITPPNFGSGAGSCLPEMVVVASGEPGVPVICWAWAAVTTVEQTAAVKATLSVVLTAFRFLTFFFITFLLVRN